MHCACRISIHSVISDRWSCLPYLFTVSNTVKDAMLLWYFIYIYTPITHIPRCNSGIQTTKIYLHICKIHVEIFSMIKRIAFVGDILIVRRRFSYFYGAPFLYSHCRFLSTVCWAMCVIEGKRNTTKILLSRNRNILCQWIKCVSGVIERLHTYGVTLYV